MTNAFRCKICDKTAYFCTAHTDTQPCTRHQLHAPQTHLFQIPTTYRYIPTENGPFRGGTLRHSKDGINKITEALGVPISTTKQWLQKLPDLHRAQTTKSKTRHKHPFDTHSVVFSTETDSRKSAPTRGPFRDLEEAVRLKAGGGPCMRRETTAHTCNADDYYVFKTLRLLRRATRAASGTQLWSSMCHVRCKGIRKPMPVNCL